jgi:hypothetical protein
VSLTDYSHLGIELGALAAFRLGASTVTLSGNDAYRDILCDPMAVIVGENPVFEQILGADPSKIECDNIRNP